MPLVDTSSLVASIVVANDALVKSRSTSVSPSAGPPLEPGKVSVSPSGGHLMLQDAEVTRSVVLADLSPLPASGTATVMTTQESALYESALKLVEALGGVDYRQIAIESNKALDAVLRMIKAEFEIAGKSDVLPVALFAKQAQQFRALLDESRRLLANTGYPVPPAALNPIMTLSAPQSTATAGSASSSAGGQSGGNRPSLTVGISGQPRVRNVSIDVPGVTASNSSTPRRLSGRAAAEPAASEQYDLRLMHGIFGETTSAVASVSPHHSASHDAAAAAAASNNRIVVRELEDEITMLRSKVDRLQSEKKMIMASNEKSAALIAQLKAKLGHDLDTIQTLQSQMEGEIRLLAIQTGNASVITSANGSGPSSSPSRLRQQIQMQQQAVAVADTQQQALLNKVSIDHHADDGFTVQDIPAGDQSAPASPSGGTAAASGAAHMPSVRFERIESLYYDVYRGKGMDMLWNTLHCVFKSEFDTQPPQGATSPAAPAGADDGGAVSDPGHLLAYNVFKAQFYDHVVSKLETYGTFLESLVQITPLRSDYIANCLKAKVKPNSGVVKLLSTITNDRDAVELTLSSNYLGDGGLAPLVPLLTRLYRLQTLRLSDIGIKNSGAQQLAQCLVHHPSLTSLDVSKNGISRSGGKDLLTLASSLPSLRVIDVGGTSIDPALQERILKRVALNATNPQPSIQQQQNTHADTTPRADPPSSAHGGGVDSPSHL